MACTLMTAASYSAGARGTRCVWCFSIRAFSPSARIRCPSLQRRAGGQPMALALAGRLTTAHTRRTGEGQTPRPVAEHPAAGGRRNVQEPKDPTKIYDIVRDTPQQVVPKHLNMRTHSSSSMVPVSSMSHALNSMLAFAAKREEGVSNHGTRVMTRDMCTRRWHC